MKTFSRFAALAMPLMLGSSLVCAQADNRAAAPLMPQAVQDAQATQAMAAPPGPKRGLTWGVYPIDPTTGTFTVSCQGLPAVQSGGGACNPYVGDTPGTARLPVLCFNKLGMPYPVPNSAPNSQLAYGSGGVVATTPPVSPIAMGWLGVPRSTVDAYCAAQFGSGWVVAEHHMGQNQGWKFGTYGNVGKPGKQRFWVHINNQPNGNVWHH